MNLNEDGYFGKHHYVLMMLPVMHRYNIICHRQMPVVQNKQSTDNVTYNMNSQETSRLVKMVEVGSCILLLCLVGVCLKIKHLFLI